MKDSNSALSLAARREKLLPFVQIVQDIKNSIAKVIVGQEEMIERILIGLFADGHVLLEGAPGLAKTLTIRSLADSVDLQFQRIQFTPDLLPADLVGTEIYSPKEGRFSTRKGPIFTNILLADEINRAPPKVQSALLEAMAEKQVTIGGQTYPLPEPFLVLATQNPLEQEGTYPLPEAQADRFMFKVLVEYPSQRDEKEILLRSWASSSQTITPVASIDDILKCREALSVVKMEELIIDYILSLVRTTRESSVSGLSLSKYIEFGASPRASLSMMHAARAHAFVGGRAFVSPDDVKAIGADVLRHRILLTYEAEAERITIDWILRQLFQKIRTP